MTVSGIFGGSFDPVHLGHLRSALELQQGLGLREVRFIPSRQPPHRGRPQAPAELRLRMLRAALQPVPGFVLDTREIERAGPSYTVDTLVELRDEMPGQSLALLLGADAFAGLPGWHRWERLLELAHVVVAHRPGTALEATGPAGELLATHALADPQALATGSGGILDWPVTALDISSSAIRELCAGGGDPRYLVPDVVRDIIISSGCYAASAGETSTLPGGKQ